MLVVFLSEVLNLKWSIYISLKKKNGEHDTVSYNRWVINTFPTESAFRSFQKKIFENDFCVISLYSSRKNFSSQVERFSWALLGREHW